MATDHMTNRSLQSTIWVHSVLSYFQR